MNKKEKEKYETWRAMQPEKATFLDKSYLEYFLEWLDRKFYVFVLVGKHGSESIYRTTAFRSIFHDTNGEYMYDGIGKTRLEAVLDICIQIAKGES